MSSPVSPVPSELQAAIDDLKALLADRSEHDVEALAAVLEARHGRGDVAALHAFVRESIAFEPYAGCLRGATGALWERAANAIDACLLLAALLSHHGVTAELCLGEIDDARARAKVLAFAARPAPPAPPFIPDRSGLSIEQLRATRALLESAQATFTGARSAARAGYDSTILLMRADVADGRALEAELRFLEWAASARPSLLLDGAALAAPHTGLSPALSGAFRAVMSEDRAAVEALFAPWMERWDARQRGHDVPPIADVLVWAARGMARLLETLSERWDTGFARRVLAAAGLDRGEVMSDLGILRRMEMEAALHERTPVLAGAIEQALSAAGIPLSAAGDSMEQAVSRARRHAVVRYRRGPSEAWSYLDPDQPGELDTPPWAADTWAGPPESLPDAHHHRVVFSVRVERRRKRDGAHVLEDAIPLRRSVRAADVVGVPIRFTLFPYSPSAEERLGSVLGVKLTGAEVLELVPLLEVGNRPYSGERVKLPREVPGAAPAVGGGRFADAIGDVTAVWLEASLEGPEGTLVLPPREWLDRFGVESRTERPVDTDAPWWLRRPADIGRELAPIPHVSGFPAPSVHWTVLVVHGGKVPPRHVEVPALAGLFSSLLGGARVPSFAPDLTAMLADHQAADRARALFADAGTVMRAGDAEAVAAVDGRVEQALFDLERASAHALLVAHASLAWGSEGGSFRAAPCLLSFETAIEDQRTVTELDLWHDALSGVEDAVSTFRSALRRSVRSALAEGIAASVGAPGGGAPSSVAESHFDAIKGGVRLIAASGDGALDSLASLGPEAIGRMRTSVPGAFAIVGAPDLAPSGAAVAGFWAIPRATGAALAVRRTGRHAAMTEYQEGQRQALLRMSSLRKEGLRKGACEGIIKEVKLLLARFGAGWKDGGFVEGIIHASLMLLKKFCKDIPYSIVVP